MNINNYRTNSCIYQIQLLVLLTICFTLYCNNIYSREYKLWYNRPAFNRGGDYNTIKAHGYPFDEDWERWSLPIGNGYMGATVFGRTDTERIQLSEKTMGNKGCYGQGGFTNFAEIYLDINHNYAKDYVRDLSLNKGIATVSYQLNNVKYYREYFANYHNNVIAVKLKSNKSGQVSFKLRPILPYLRPYNEEKTGRTGKVFAKDNLIIMNGNVQYFDLAYECQIRVKHYGGNIKTKNDKNNDNGCIYVQEADSVELFIIASTSYTLNEETFLRPMAKKFTDNIHPHDYICKKMELALNKGYDVLKKEHIEDVSKLFERVSLNLSDSIPSITTDQLVQDYKNGKKDIYLEELFFHYGRYLLIASSRKGSLPPNLQGAWTQYDYTPWSGGYWHNINIQMNYWPIFNTNLTELFYPFVQYNEAYRKAAEINATNYVKKNNPNSLSEKEGENGWTIGTGATAYAIGSPGGHSGPGTGGFTTKLYWDYYDFTRDKTILKTHVYPALEGMAKFLLKTLKPDGKGHLLADPSSSPENKHNDKYYTTIGCTFDQCMIWECFRDLLEAADILKINNSTIKEVRKQIKLLDPILIGEEGQLKEYREERYYSEFGEPQHRHISHLCAVYPGTLINTSTKDWMEAAKIALKKRGDASSIRKGWPAAHRMTTWARLRDGNKAHSFYEALLTWCITENLWDLCPPFNIDGNLGGTAGVAEMLLQSHENLIEPLPALPDKWKNGSYDGLLSRGNFEVSVKWNNKELKSLNILSNKGEICRIKYNNISKATITDNLGKNVKIKVLSDSTIEFKTIIGKNYNIVL